MDERSNRVIAVYDGREKGGTVGTIRLVHTTKISTVISPEITHSFNTVADGRVSLCPQRIFKIIWMPVTSYPQTGQASLRSCGKLSKLLSNGLSTGQWFLHHQGRVGTPPHGNAVTYSFVEFVKDYLTKESLFEDI